MDLKLGMVSPSGNFENSLRKKTPPQSSSRNNQPKLLTNVQVENVVEKLHETEVNILISLQA